ncbi:MAG: glycogen debranching protein, partial [Verrucomicrobiaceae bacterium]
MHTNKLVRRIDLSQAGAESREYLRREWLLTNGLGGYASGTISGRVSRRYHGLLVAALPAPLGRVAMFNHLSEHLVFPDGREVQIGGEEPNEAEDSPNPFQHYVTEFRLENQLPVWRYEVEGVILEKQMLLIHGQNTIHINFSLLSAHENVRLALRPSLHFRPHEHSVGSPLDEFYTLTIAGRHYEVSAGDPYPPLRFLMQGERASFTHEGGEHREIGYQHEAERGYESRGQLWSPGYFSVTLAPRRTATLIASTEDWPTVLA